DPGMDMEADLSIDSIKRTEIIGEVKNSLGKEMAELFGDSGGKRGEQLAAVKTLNGLSQWLYSMTEGAQQTGPTDSAGQPATASPATYISRSRFELTADFPA